MSKEAIKTARRLFEILEYFNKVQRPLSLKEVAGRFGYPVSSASAVLKSMVVLGYIDFDRYSHTYMPTMRIVQLGKWVERSLFGEPGMISLVDHLNRATEEMVAIATQSDLYMQYIHVQPSPHAIQVPVQPGAIRPLARSGLGWMLLSARSDDAIEKLVRRINYGANVGLEHKQYGLIPGEQSGDVDVTKLLGIKNRKQKVDLKELMLRIRRIRNDGYVISLHTVVAGGGAIGMLLPQRQHGRVLAIGVGGPVERLVAKRAHILRSLHEGIEKFVKRGEMVACDNNDAQMTIG
jgi:IclR family KDG regulon transcriptional repressor